VVVVVVVGGGGGGDGGGGIGGFRKKNGNFINSVLTCMGSSPSQSLSPILFPIRKAPGLW
jgi:hypothetical protein